MSIEICDLFLTTLKIFSQDTVVALQALALHSEKTTGNNNLDLRVKVETEKGDVREFHHINPENALLRREVKVR